MRKSFELLDWMKEHFGGNGSTPGGPGQPGILYRFTHGLKETGGVVKVDEGNGLAVNEHTGMLEVPIGEHLSYTSQGIDAKEGDTAQKGVVRLSDTIMPESTHETAVTPQAVKEYVDANAGSGGGFDLTEDRSYSGVGTVQFNTITSSSSARSVISLDYNNIVSGVVALPGGAYVACQSTDGTAYISVGSSIGLRSASGGELTVGENVKIGEYSVITTANRADERNLGVVKLTHTVSHGEHPNEAVSPDGVAAYVDAKVADAGGFSIVKAMQATPDFALIDGSMVQSGKLAYGVLTFACATQTSVADIALLPLMPKSPFTVNVVRMSNNPGKYEATVGDDGNVAFSSEKIVAPGTYTVTIAMQTK